MLLEMNVKLRRGHFDLTTQLSFDGKGAGLFGKSGAGKSTVLGLIAGTIEAQSGYIVLDGQTLFDSRKGISVPYEQRPVGAVLQLHVNDTDETVRNVLATAYQRIQHRRCLFKPDFLIGLLELGTILEHSLDALSLGERQRVALACSLLKSPKLLVLDDTFAAFGSAYKMQLLPILKRLQQEFNLGILYASQSLGAILELTDQMIILDSGKVLRSGSLREVAKQQGVFRYLGIRQLDNILPVVIRDQDYDAGCSLAESFGLPLALPLRSHFTIGSRTQVSIRANDIALSRHYIDGISIQNQIKGRICALIPNGDSIIVQVDCGGTLLAEITPGGCRQMALHEGDTVYCLIKTHAIVYLSELDDIPYQRVVNYGDAYYYLSAAELATDSLLS